MDMTGVAEVNPQWKQQVAMAKIAWASLTEDELLCIDGEAGQLVELVQQRYAISREEAEKQVTFFFRYGWQ